MQRCPKCRSLRLQRGYHDTGFWLRSVGINFLLCNNCNAEFRGFSLFGVKRSRERKIEVKHRPKVGNKQRAPRKRARLNLSVNLYSDTGNNPFTVSSHSELNNHYHAPSTSPLLAARSDSVNKRERILRGYTRDVSCIGLSLVLPEARLSDDYLAQDKHRLSIHLIVPGDNQQAASVTLHAVVVRFEQLDDGEALSGWLIGARLTWIKPEDRARFLRYVDTLS